MKIFFLNFLVTDARRLRDLFCSNNDETSELAHELADAKILIQNLSQESQELKNVINAQNTKYDASIAANEQAIQELKEELRQKEKLYRSFFHPSFNMKMKTF